MYESVVMHVLESFENLRDDFSRLPLGKRSCQVSLQVAVRKVLHGDEDGISALEPAIGPNEAVRVLRQTDPASAKIPDRGLRHTYPWVGELGNCLELSRMINLLPSHDVLVDLLDGTHPWLRIVGTSLLVDGAIGAAPQTAFPHPALLDPEASPF